MGTQAQTYIQLNEYLDIDGHIKFAEDLIGKYRWDARTKNNLSTQLQRIREKQNDKCLNLSVVGEFSTGKSSFINALLGENLLVSSVIQGTTVVNTIIEYYDRPTLYVQKKDGSYTVNSPKDIKELSALLSGLTTNANIAKGIKLVRVGIPSELLYSGVRIIDTPGTNSTESWHEDITKEAIKNLSDLSIILTDAIHPVSQTLINFIDANLSDVFNQCAFVVTYYDKLRKEERLETVEYIKRKLHDELEIKEPVVLPFIAPAVLASLARKTIMQNQEEMIRVSKESHARLLEIMWKNRQISQIKKLLSLTKYIFETLEYGIESQKTVLDKELSLLLRTKQTSLDPFIEYEKKRCINQFGHLASDLKDKLNMSIGSRISVAKGCVKNSIMNLNASTADDIKTHLTTSVPNECNNQAKYVAQVVDEMNKDLLDAFNETMASYHKNFERQFNKLGILKVNLAKISIERPNIQSVSLKNLGDSLDYMSQEVSRENWALGGGGVAGAALGTAILPGIGTVVGGLLGMFVGAMNTPSTDDLKKNACDKLSGPLETVFQSVERDIISTFNENIIAYKTAIINEIDRYLKKYKSIIDRRIAEHDSLIENNKIKTQRVEVDLKLITLRRNQLKSLTDSLN